MPFHHLRPVTFVTTPSLNIRSETQGIRRLCKRCSYPASQKARKATRPHAGPTYPMASAVEEVSQPVPRTQATEEEEVKLTLADGSDVGAFFTKPSGSPAVAGAGVILMTDILGYQNDDTRSVARRLAGGGLPTIVPDLFREAPWKEGRSMSEYEEWRSQHDPARVREDVKSAFQFLQQRGLGSPLGMLGFCFGGGRLMEEIALSSHGLNPKVAVAFYPTRFDPEDVGRNATCSLLFITGDEDNLVPMSVVEKFQQTVTKENSEMEDCEVQIVEGAGHAFAHHPKSEQDEVDGELVLSRAVWYLRSKL